MIALVELGRVPVAVAAFLAAATGAVVNFTGNKLWSFQDRTPTAFRQLAAYVLVCIATWSFVALAVHLLFTVGTPYVLAKAVAQILVFISWSYPAQARFVFASAPSPVKESPCASTSP